MSDACKNPALNVDIAGIRMKNPVMVASGTFGYGSEYGELVDLNQLGAVVVKGIHLEPCNGNAVPRLVEVPGGLVNAIGLQNPGAEKFIREHMPFLRQFDVPVIVNIWGRTMEEYAGVAARFDGVDGIAALELNISCPNVKEGGLAFGTDPVVASELISFVRTRTELPLIVKLTPNVPDIRVFARAAEDAGADAISLINSVPAMVIDVDTRRPVLANIVGGLSGPAVHSIAVKLVWEASRATSLPVIGMGGITEARDALEFIIAGAAAVAVGTANFKDPDTPLKVAAGIEAYLKRHGLSSISELTGTLELLPEFQETQ